MSFRHTGNTLEISRSVLRFYCSCLKITLIHRCRLWIPSFSIKNTLHSRITLFFLSQHYKEPLILLAFAYKVGCKQSVVPTWPARFVLIPCFPWRLACLEHWSWPFDLIQIIIKLKLVLNNTKHVYILTKKKIFQQNIFCLWNLPELKALFCGKNFLHFGKSTTTGKSINSRCKLRRRREKCKQNLVSRLFPLPAERPRRKTALA